MTSLPQPPSVVELACLRMILLLQVASLKSADPRWPNHDAKALTARSCIGYWKNGQVQTIIVDNASTMPSCVAFNESGKIPGLRAKNDVSAAAQLHQC